jgi:hypothetical protein
MPTSFCVSNSLCSFYTNPFVVTDTAGLTVIWRTEQSIVIRLRKFFEPAVSTMWGYAIIKYTTKTISGKETDRWKQILRNQFFLKKFKRCFKSSCFRIVIAGRLQLKSWNFSYKRHYDVWYDVMSCWSPGNPLSLEKFPDLNSWPDEFTKVLSICFLSV